VARIQTVHEVIEDLEYQAARLNARAELLRQTCAADLGAPMYTPRRAPEWLYVVTAAFVVGFLWFLEADPKSNILWIALTVVVCIVLVSALVVGVKVVKKPNKEVAAVDKVMARQSIVPLRVVLPKRVGPRGEVRPFLDSQFGLRESLKGEIVTIDASDLRVGTTAYVDELVKIILVELEASQLIFEGLPEQDAFAARASARRRGVTKKLQLAQLPTPALRRHVVSGSLE
jgi:hypothetical protein